MFKKLPDDALENFFEKADVDFNANIVRMHEMYRLPITDRPSLYNLTKPNGEAETAVDRITGYLKTIRDEVSEGDLILQKLSMLDLASRGHSASLDATADDSPAWQALVQFSELLKEDPEEAERYILVEMADWFADKIVYITSEALKFGIPIDTVLHLVMASNFTKLPADGIPKHDANGKFLKDMTNFVPPEDAIYSVIFDDALYSDAEDENGDDYQDDDDEDFDSDDNLDLGDNSFEFDDVDTQLAAFRSQQLTNGIPEEDVIPEDREAAVNYLIQNQRDWS